MGVVNDISDEDLREYLPFKGDRVAVKAFARRGQTETESDKRKLSLIENLKSRMKLARTPKSNHSSDMDDGEVSDPKRNRSALSKAVAAKDKLSFGSTNARPAMVASKAERAIVVGFSIYDPTNASGSK